MLVPNILTNNIFSRSDGSSPIHLASYNINPGNISADNTSPKSWGELLQEATNAQNNSEFPAVPVILANEAGPGGINRFQPTGIRQTERTTQILGTFTVDGYLRERPVSGELTKRVGSGLLGLLRLPTHKLKLHSDGAW